MGWGPLHYRLALSRCTPLHLEQEDIIIFAAGLVWPGVPGRGLDVARHPLSLGGIAIYF